MVGRISVRWTNLPPFLRPGFAWSAGDICFSCKKILFDVCGTGPSRFFVVIVFIMVVFLIGLFLTVDFNQYHSKTRRFNILKEVSDHGSNSQYYYGVVVDCGSSGSRVFIYYWPPHNGKRDELLQIKQMMDSRGNPVRLKIKPGISSYVDKPSEASTYIEPLLDFAAFHIPQHKHRETPLYILATAGMRMLSKVDQDAILDDLRVDVSLKYSFQFASSHVEVITGKQEGIYSWIGVNFELGRFDHSSSGPVTLNGSISQLPRKRTVGSLDMGGGSAQIAFEVGKSVWVPSDLSAKVNLGCDLHHTTHNYYLYVATFLGFGGNAARNRYTDLALTDNKTLKFDSASGAYLDPCLPAECTEKATYQGTEFRLLGTGEYHKCQELLVPLLNVNEPCPRGPCSLNGVYQPNIDYVNSEFYGFSEYWYSMHDVLRIGGQYSASQMKHAVAEFCKTRWSLLVKRHAKGLYPFADDHRLKFQCFKAAWMTTVLHRGFHFPLNYSSLRSAFFIGDKEVQWTLGAILYRTRFLPLREMQVHSQYNSSYHVLWSYVSEFQFRVIFIVCSITVVAAILLYCRRLRRMSKSSFWNYNSKVVLYNSDVSPRKEKIPV